MDYSLFQGQDPEVTGLKSTIKDTAVRVISEPAILQRLFSVLIKAPSSNETNETKFLGVF